MPSAFPEGAGLTADRHDPIPGSRDAASPRRPAIDAFPRTREPAPRLSPDGQVKIRDAVLTAGRRLPLWLPAPYPAGTIHEQDRLPGF
jgi:hypothetical protein